MNVRPIRLPLLLAVLALAVTACRSFDVRKYPEPASLYQAGLERYADKKYNDAITAFERLTFDLPTRDPMLPLAHWWLGQSRRKNNERLLAAQSFARLAEQFPNDTLADDAMFMAARSYRELWRRPSLDPEYGMLAQSQFRLVMGVYPDSPYADSSQAELAELDEWFASKDYETGMHYFRRKAYDSSLLYFRDVVAKFPNTDKARLAMLQMVRIYRLPAVNYAEDAEEVCGALLGGFPNDPEVKRLCAAPAASDSTAAPVPPADLAARR